MEEMTEDKACYEIQLESGARGKGLGKFLMKKVMLTVLKQNERAINFFGNIMKFQTDETSPVFWDPLNPEDYCYDILSKSLTRKTTVAN
ncbi:N-alpha-acetyltransferase 40 [Acropora cervicornis]|uniref:N-alpha-acetyltransferase 40 n=1 Tax=Acropora cervicornis TaxID=6130 RepID=A0AAD9QWI8_ACRCE|nr:N-alpha-acetyltransferase 40 [Acropora cervicornis]